MQVTAGTPGTAILHSTRDTGLITITTSRHPRMRALRPRRRHLLTIPTRAMKDTSIMARTEVVLLSLGLAACASRSIGSDVSRVRTLAQVEALPRVTTEDVEGPTSHDVHQLLDKALTADSAVRVALLNNRELRAKLRELGISRGRLLQAGLIANPTFEVEVLPERDSDLELRAEYDVSSLVLAPLASRAAGAELESARYQVAGEVVKLGYEARTAFYAVQGATLRLAYAQRTLDALTAGRDAALALLEAGNVPQLEASRQVVAFENARIEVAKLELSLADAREQLARLLGLYGEDVEARLEPSFAPVPEALTVPDKLETRVLEASLDMKSIQQSLVAAGRRTGVARTSAFLPEVAVDVHALRAKPHDAGDDSKWRYGGGVSVGVPLFDRKQGTLRTAEAQFDVLREREQQLAIELRSRAREARNRLVSTHARVRLYESTLLPAQRTVMEQTLLQYNAMQLGVFELLAARRSELDIELAFVDAQRAYWESAAALDALLAGKVVTGVESGAVSALGAGGEAGGGH